MATDQVSPPSPSSGSLSSSTHQTTKSDGPEYRLPARTVLKKAEDYILYDIEGRKTQFRSLYLCSPQKQRTLVLFIRHFFCGNCQEFLRSLVQDILPASLPSDVDIKIIGCGSHTLIKSYLDQLDCSPPFPYQIYAEPTKKLYELLGMQYTLSMGAKSPEYIQRSLIRINLESTVQGIKRLWCGDALSGGDMRLNGGEFLFEVDDGEANVTWCHRMMNSRDHVEIESLKQILRLDQPVAAAERPGVIRRRSTADRLRRSFSNRRQSWLGRTGSLSRTRSTKDHSREQSRRRSFDRNIDMVREELRSRDGEDKPATSAMNGGMERSQVST